jgi:hypothetical protein
MGRDAEAARIRLAVSDPLPARQRQQTAMGKTMFQNRFTKKIFSLFSHFYKADLVESIVLLRTQQT